MRERDTVYRLSSQFSKFNMIRFRFGEWRIDEFGCHSDHLSMGWFVGYDCFLYFPILNIGFIGWGSNLHLFLPMRCSSVFIRFCIFCMDEECSLCFKKTWPPSHETKWCGDKRGDISAILRVFPSGSLRVPFGFPPMSSHQNSTGYWTGPLIFWSRFFMKTMSRRSWKMLKVSTFAKCESPGMGC